MKKNIKSIYIIAISFLGLGLASCDDLLDVHVKGTTDADAFFTSSSAAEQSVTAAYAPLSWIFNETYYPEWFIGDVVSDDALKGGQNIADMNTVYDMENFKTQSNNTYLLDFYRGQYMGIFRANLVLEKVANMTMDLDNNPALITRVLAEARFLRAYYYFRLVRIFGGVPRVDFVIKYQADWKQPRASAEDIYSLIYSDLLAAIPDLPLKSKYAATDLGRATQGAARALLMNAYMNNHEYAKAKAQGDTIISSGEYSLNPNYADNFTLAGENGPESVFEIQYTAEGTSDYGQGNGFTRGNFSVIMTRSRGAGTDAGWGFNHPSQELYDSYESGDPRRDVTIYTPTTLSNPTEEIYLGNQHLNRKYAMMNDDDSYIKLDHPSRAPINQKEIRYADVLLMYAEACCETGNLDAAKSALEQVRNRARQGNASILPSFPYGSYADNKDGLIQAIRHERRVELGMEGKRWFDLIRWGIAGDVMNNYRETTSDLVKAQMSPFVKGKHELFPIPLEEIEMNPMTQNPGY